MPNTGLYGGSDKFEYFETNANTYHAKYINCTFDVLSCLNCCENDPECQGILWNNSCYKAYLNKNTSGQYKVILVITMVFIVTIFVFWCVYLISWKSNAMSQPDREKTVTTWRPIINNLNQCDLKIDTDNNAPDLKRFKNKIRSDC